VELPVTRAVLPSSEKISVLISYFEMPGTLPKWQRIENRFFWNTGSPAWPSGWLELIH